MTDEHLPPSDEAPEQVPDDTRPGVADDETDLTLLRLAILVLVEYNFNQDRVTRVAQLPNEVPEIPREQYLLDSAHHGIAMNSTGTKLCVAGTMSDYAAMVSRKTFAFKLLHLGEKPYWSTTSKDGRNCYVSWSGTDEISVISYVKEREIARVPVGDLELHLLRGGTRPGRIDNRRLDGEFPGIELGVHLAPGERRRDRRARSARPGGARPAPAGPPAGRWPPTPPAARRRSRRRTPGRAGR